MRSVYIDRLTTSKRVKNDNNVSLYCNKHYLETGWKVAEWQFDREVEWSLSSASWEDPIFEQYLVYFEQCGWISRIAVKC
jgi:hypothetical protein